MIAAVPIRFGTQFISVFCLSFTVLRQSWITQKRNCVLTYITLGEWSSSFYRKTNTKLATSVLINSALMWSSDKLRESRGSCTPRLAQKRTKKHNHGWSPSEKTWECVTWVFFGGVIFYSFNSKLYLTSQQKVLKLRIYATRGLRSTVLSPPPWNAVIKFLADLIINAM